MSLAKSGQITNCCGPNALITLKEYLLDYASNNVKETGNLVIEKEIKKIPNNKIQKLTVNYLKEIEEGKRDFRF